MTEEQKNEKNIVSKLETSLDPDHLEENGWERRFVGAGPRLKEMVSLYRKLGYRVRLVVPDESELREECDDCQMARSLMRVVYTRKDEPSP